MHSGAILRDLLPLGAVGAGIWMTYRLGRIVAVLILAMFFAYVIAPLVEVAQYPISLTGRSRRLTRGTAIAVVYLLLAGAAGAGAAILWPSAAQQLDEAIVSAPRDTESFRAGSTGGPGITDACGSRSSCVTASMNRCLGRAMPRSRTRADRCWP